MNARSVPLAVRAEATMSARTWALQGWWALYILLNPLYLSPSGGLQPAHLFLIATFPIAFFLWIRQIPVCVDLFTVSGGFMCYVLIVNMIWYVRYYSNVFLLSSCYVMYNMIMLIVVATVFAGRSRSLARTTRLALLATLAGEAAAMLAIGDQGYGRAMGTFNDPNQMGYWALLSAACYFVVRDGRRLRVADLVALGLAGLIIFFSVSRAAILGFATLFVLVALFSRVDPRRMMLGATVVLVAFLLARTADVAPDQSYQDVLNFAEQRFASKDTANDSLAERGYARLWLFPEYLLLGAGDGEYPARFNLANETHSTVGSILFAYGIVGLTLFGLLLFVLMRRADWFRMSLLLPVMIYGIAQQGVRFSMFWTFLALVFALSRPEDDHACTLPDR